MRHGTLMFLRRNRRTVDGQTYDYWTLVRTVRTAQGPRQQVVASLGKTPGLDQRSRHGWDDIADLLEGRSPAPRQVDLPANALTYEMLSDPSGATFDPRDARVSLDTDRGAGTGQL